MSWLSPPQKNSDAPSNKRASFRQPMDLDVQVEVTGKRMPLNATIINVSTTGCQLRSWIMLERGATIAFDWPREHVQFRLEGEIVARRSSTQGAAFEYGVSFSRLSPQSRDLLAKEIAEKQRREASRRASEHAPKVTTSGSFNRRHAYRAHAEFPVHLRFEERTEKSVNVLATDISIGGLRIVCDALLTPGADVTVRFRLPDAVLNVYPPGIQEYIAQTPFGPRRRTKNNRRPFEEMSIRSRIAAPLKDWHGRPAFGVAFVEIDVYTREEIARFIHAVQLGKLRERKPPR